MWRGINVVADSSRPALISVKDAMEVLNNASYGGVPVAFSARS